MDLALTGFYNNVRFGIIFYIDNKLKKLIIYEKNFSSSHNFGIDVYRN